MECYQRLGERILRTLGHPMVNVELHPDQLYEAISMSLDFFTSYNGYTKETLLFDSKLYEHDKGIRLDHLFTVANTGYTTSEILKDKKIGPDPDFQVDIPETLYISQSAIPYTLFATASSLSASVPDNGITKMQIINEATYQELIFFDANLTNLFIPSKPQNFTIQCNPEEDVKTFNNLFDYDILDYRKVIDVVGFEEGSSNGVNNLFSMESILAQQAFSSFAMGNFGFDMLSWHTTKSWIDMREKVFATRRDMSFDNRTQYLRFFPQPRNSHFFGAIECYVERPIRDLVKEKWVLEYSTALAKIMWGRILTKISGVNLLGGGTLNGGEVLQEGVADKERLETMLIEGGYGGMEPIMMSVF